jgi:hypothetical protein
MKEVVGDFIRKPIGSTFFQGLMFIDRVWATSDITICSAAIMPAGYGIGDHWLFVISFASADIIGSTPPKVTHPAFRRLNTKLSWVAADYAKFLKEMILRHCLIECVGKAHSSSKSRCSITGCLNHLDKELGQYTQYAKKNCCKIKSGRTLFSPKASL